MAETLTIRTASSTEVVKIAVPGPQGPKGDKGDPGDVAGLPLSTQGDILYRGASENQRLPIGTTGQVLKVAGGIPSWANESGAVTSVNGATGAVTVAAEQHASEHEAGEADELQAMAALVTTDASVEERLDGVYFHDGTTTSGRPNFFRIGTRKNTKLQWNNSTGVWELIKNNVTRAQSEANASTRPWNGGTWEDPASPPVITSIAVTRLGLEDMVQKVAETGSAATATTSQDGLISAADQQKLNGIAAGAEVNVNADWNASSGDAQILNKPSTFTPTAHAASHASAGSDPLFDQDLNTTDNATFNELTVTNVINAESATLTDLFVAGFEASGTGGNLLRVFGNGLEFVGTSAATTRTNLGLGDSATADIGTGSTEVAAGDHVHGNINSSGLVGTTANLPLKTGTGGIVEAGAFGTGAGEFSEGNHTHELTALAATGATNGHVLTANGSGGVTFAASSGGVTAVDSTTADVFSVSGSNLVADDGGLIDSANPFVQWNDTSNKLVYANPLSRPAGAMYVGVAPTTTALGTDAINIQSGRSTATRVASGSTSIAIGNFATASSTADVAIGTGTQPVTASGSYSVAVGVSTVNHRATATGAVALGVNCQATGSYGLAVGADAQATQASSVGIGYGAVAQAINATAIGLEVTSDLRSAFFTRPFRSVYWGGQTTNNTATILNLDAAATNRFTIAANTALAVDILLVARRSDVADKWLVARRFLGIRRDGSNNTSLIGTVQNFGMTDQSGGSPTWSFALTADDTNDALQLEVTGATGETVQWRACAIYRVV